MDRVHLTREMEGKIQEKFFHVATRRRAVVLTVEFIGWKRVHFKVCQKLNHQVKLVKGHEKLGDVTSFYVKRRKFKKCILGGFESGTFTPRHYISDYIHIDSTRIKEFCQKKWFSNSLPGKFEELYDVNNIYLTGEGKYFLLYAQNKKNANKHTLFALNLSYKTLWALIKKGEYVSDCYRPWCKWILEPSMKLIYDNQGILVELENQN